MREDMKRGQEFVFPPFRLDCVNECLWRDAQQISLRGKTFAVLRHLLESPGQLMTKEALFATVWPDTYVTEGALTICITELRKALGDSTKTPRYIETVHRRGYRFIGTVVSGQSSVASPPPTPPLRSQLIPNSRPPLPTLVGREAELAQLHRWWAKALDGERQIVFVSGEAGIGKTTVVETFLQQMASAPVWIGRGQCVEHYGAGEGYMPVLEALGRLCRESEGVDFIEFLTQHAPTWLAQMPALLSAEQLEALQWKTQGATRERMLREMAEAVEALTAARPLVLRLEDLHWSDHSTLELLSVLARRREAARLLVLGTYRPVEMLANGHPLRTVRQELQLHKQCEEQRLGFLTEAHVAEYLARRFRGVPSPLAGEGQDGGASRQKLNQRPPHPSPLPRGEREGEPTMALLRELARMVHQRTDGNPLFMVNVVEYLAVQGGLRASVESGQVGIPGDLRQMIEEQLHRLSPAERRVLEVASVAGVEFSAAAVAAGLGVAVEEVEEQCEGLGRREQFLRMREPAEWPDGTVASRYQFVHALYQEVVYGRIPAARRSTLHRRIGERTEAAYGDRAGEIAAELAVHFERGRDYRRAIQYLRQAGENAVRRSAHQEAINLLTKGLELLNTLPDTPERIQQELTLHLALGVPLRATKGYGAPEVKQTYTRARELCRHLGETPQLFPALWGLRYFYFIRAELQTARELGQELLSLAQRVQDPALLVQAHFALGATLLVRGELPPARALLEQGVALYDPLQHRSHALLYSQDPKVASLSIAAHLLWLLGYPDQALKSIHDALTLAQELSHPFSLAFALIGAARLHQCRREGKMTQERADAAITLSTEQRFSPWLARGTTYRGWALAEQGQGEEGIAEIRQGLAVTRSIEQELGGTQLLAMLAETYGGVGQPEEGLAALAKALVLVDKTEERMAEAELYRLKGQLTLQKLSVISCQFSVTDPRPLIPDPQGEAEACFLKAIEVAQKQQAKSLELRATTSLARLWQQQGKRHEVRNTLSDIYNWFTEGFGTKDLQEAKALLDSLESRV
jgi:DNA-binding winged helix-turn-helix (wHTH) protein/predicted ATPase